MGGGHLEEANPSRRHTHLPQVAVNNTAANTLQSQPLLTSLHHSCLLPLNPSQVSLLSSLPLVLP